MSSKKKGKKTKQPKNAYVNNLDEDNNIANNIEPKGTINSLPTLDYIRVTVQEEVQQGLLKVAREKPDNPIEFLGKFLVNASKKKKQNYKLEWERIFSTVTSARRQLTVNQ